MKPLILAIGLLSGQAATSQAQEISGSVSEGSKIAQETCSACHAVSGGNFTSPNIDAPPFQDIADKRGMTEMALSVWFRSPHPTMPNFILNEYEASHLVAYILGLKKD